MWYTEYSDNYRSISKIKSSISLESRGSSPYLPPEIRSLPSRHRGSNTAESERGREIHSYPCTWATRSDKGQGKELVREDKHRGSDHVAKQSARLRLSTSVNHPADPTTNMQRKKLSSSSRRPSFPLFSKPILSRFFSSYAPRTNRR